MQEYLKNPSSPKAESTSANLLRHSFKKVLDDSKGNHSSRNPSNRLRVIYAGLMVGVSAFSLLHFIPTIADEVDFYIIGGGGGGGATASGSGGSGGFGGCNQEGNKGGGGKYDEGGHGGGAFVGAESDIQYASSGDNGGDGYLYTGSAPASFDGGEHEGLSGGKGGSVVNDNNTAFSLNATSLPSLNNLYIGGGDGGYGGTGVCGMGDDGGEVKLSINGNINTNGKIEIESGKGGADYDSSKKGGQWWQSRADGQR
jgi:hypothetical protein